MRRCFAASLLLFAVMAIFVVVTAGCGQRANYSKAKVTSPLNRSGSCAACRKKIESVASTNLVVIDGGEYIICNDKCIATLRKRLAWENGR